LEWEEKAGRRINPTAQLKGERVRVREQAGEKSIVIKLSGWDYGQSQFDPDTL
jgi:hypothetical protein